MSWISDALIEFISSHVSLHLASSYRGQASLVRAYGCYVDRTQQQIILLVDEQQAEPVLLAIRKGAPVAAVFNEPETHRTVQLKASQAQVWAADAGDYSYCQSYGQRFSQRLQVYDVPVAYSLALCEVAPERMVRVVFKPEAAFNQTPGKTAGGKMTLQGNVP